MLNKNFREFIELLNAKGVEYLVVGGYAVAMYGYPRYTGDMDFFVAMTPENAALLLAALRDFGFANETIDAKAFLKKDNIVEIGREPNMIHILTSIEGVVFDNCYGRRVTVRDGDIEVPFISLEDLLKNKSSTRRAKDKLDVIELEKLIKKKK